MTIRIFHQPYDLVFGKAGREVQLFTTYGHICPVILAERLAVLMISGTAAIMLADEEPPRDEEYLNGVLLDMNTGAMVGLVDDNYHVSHEFGLCVDQPKLIAKAKTFAFAVGNRLTPGNQDKC